ncbi:hypothetical protein [Mangrovibacterium marinum]|uniref:Tetratricopeptide repeat protein n=1 Tax=Mangrovibacterium marinum TaxID=1639118 RepID=A0A2T5C281_9BACT|nr:hypothetical protein [Mangrovibacterium marinum]PTN08766.1 hypothetical protein C8N47_107126 [Mangrovibacterium marinum]
MQTSEFHKFLQNPRLLNEASLPLFKELVQQYPAFQLGWMLLLKNLKLVESPEFDFYLAKGAFYTTDRRKLYHFLMTEDALEEKEMDSLANEYASAGSYQLEPEPQPAESLSDLVKTLRRKAPAEADKPAENKAEEQERTDAPEFVTETLAKIYMRQGMYKQAILAYEKLSLKYPEKNTYFAGQIEEVKKLIH